MKSAIIALCVIGCAYAAITEQEAKVLANNYDQSPEGNFQYNYETENGIQGVASAQVKPISKDEVALEITGSNQYKSPEGDIIQLTYLANENGYQPQGSHLPTPPAPQPIPEYIQRALQYIREHPYVEKKL